MFVQTKLFKKLGFSIRKKIPDQHYGKIPDQEFKLWSTKYLKLKIRSKSWYIHNFFEPVSNNESSTSPFYATVIGYFDILIFWYFDIFFNNCPRFSQIFEVSSIRISKLHTCVLSTIFFPASKPKSDLINEIFIENQLAIKTNQSGHGFVTVCPMKYLPLKIGAYIFLPCLAILDSSNLMVKRSSDLV